LKIRHDGLQKALFCAPVLKNHHFRLVVTDFETDSDPLPPDVRHTSATPGHY
jgi:hypothetical protein